MADPAGVRTVMCSQRDLPAALFGDGPPPGTSAVVSPAQAPVLAAERP